MSSPEAEAAQRAVEEVARTSYGRLVAYLASTTSDLAGAEDALADAFEAALRTWPERGVPDRPTSWMITAAKRSLIGRLRRRLVADRALPSLALLAAERELPDEPSPVGDKRLELLFACAHPAIDRRVHAALMLQAVLGLDVARMAPAFHVEPAALGQRLVRAKRKLRDAGIGFAPPGAEDLVGRLGAVLDAIYAAYATGWEDPLGTDEGRTGLVEESIRLATLTSSLLDHPEAHGLAALLLHSHARQPARRDGAGRLVRLEDQDPGRWSTELIEQADGHLARAFAAGDPGRYQVQAAIQSVHNHRSATRGTDWTAVAGLYDALVRWDRSVGAEVARAAAHLEAHGPDPALQILEAIDPPAAGRYQPYWAVRAEALHRAGRDDTARTAALERAIDLAADPAVADDLRRRGASWSRSDKIGAA